jgi:Rrf2 family nitric oxide-sensitive transcriptional repressor
MRLTLHTDYGLRVLLVLARERALDRAHPLTVPALATALDVSREHLVKVVQALAAAGWVATRPGRGGGVHLAVAPDALDVADVVAHLEGRGGVLACVAEPAVCVLEPGCRLRRKLMAAEDAFYAALAGTSVADLVRRPRATDGLARLAVR